MGGSFAVMLRQRFRTVLPENGFTAFSRELRY